MLGLVSRAAAALLFCLPAVAQEHHHPPQDVSLHEKFYTTWFMLAERLSSCCSMKDCYPVQVRHENGQLYFLRREDQKWVLVPAEIIEQNAPQPRESPDGLSHVCAPPPGTSRGDIAFCFTYGSGT